LSKAIHTFTFAPGDNKEMGGMVHVDGMHMDGSMDMGGIDASMDAGFGGMDANVDASWDADASVDAGWDADASVDAPDFDANANIDAGWDADVNAETSWDANAGIDTDIGMGGMDMGGMDINGSIPMSNHVIDTNVKSVTISMVAVDEESALEAWAFQTQWAFASYYKPEEYPSYALVM